MGRGEKKRKREMLEARLFCVLVCVGMCASMFRCMRV